jgi:hypothetical protein
MTFHYQFDQQGKIKGWNSMLLGNPDTVMKGMQQFVCD